MYRSRLAALCACAFVLVTTASCSFYESPTRYENASVTLKVVLPEAASDRLAAHLESKTAGRPVQVDITGAVAESQAPILVGVVSIQGYILNRCLVATWTLTKSTPIPIVTDDLHGTIYGCGTVFNATALSLQSSARVVLSGVLDSQIHTLVLQGTASELRPVSPSGMVVVPSDLPFTDSAKALTAALEANENIRLVATVDIAKMAAKIGYPVGPSTTVVFGNPNIGTPLMLDQQPVGIDLPQKLSIYTSGIGNVYVAYNVPQYLKQRHSLSDSIDGTLDTLGNALASLAAVATGRPVDDILELANVVTTQFTPKLNNKPLGKSMETVASAIDTSQKIQRMSDTIHISDTKVARSGDVYTVIHSDSPPAVEAGLRMTIVTATSSPYMAAMAYLQPSIAIDAPTRILHYTDAESVERVAYDALEDIMARHDVSTIDYNAAQLLLKAAMEDQAKFVTKRA